MPRKKSDPNLAEQKLEIVLKRLEAEKLRCVDTETSGLDWRRNHIVGYVLTFGPDPRDSFYVPFRHAGTGNVGGQPGPLDPHGWDRKLHPGEQAIIKGLGKEGSTNFGHNLAFDLKMLLPVGQVLDGVRWEDTIINAPLLDEYEAKFSLEYLAATAKVFNKKSSLVINHIRQKFPEAPEKGAMGFYYRLDGDDPITVEYAEGDGTSTWQLRDWQNPQFLVEDRWGRSLAKVQDIESRLIPVLARMSHRGIKIDEERLQEISKEVADRLEQLKNAFPADFNSRSPNDVRAWLEKNNTTHWPLTPKGKPSFPELWLLKSNAGKAVVDVRKLETLESSFIGPMRNTHLWKGRVHTTFNQLRGDEYGTITGRLSSSEPNLQQVPKRNVELGRIFRSIFIPDKGKVWASVDFSQCEPRLLAFYSGARVLIDGYLADPPVDAHTSVTIATNPDWEELDKTTRKDRRETGKRVNQTILTGGGARALGHYGVQDPERVLKEYFDRMPEIKALQKQSARVIRTRGYVSSLLARRAHMSDKDYIAVNRLLQCGNADVIKLKMVEIDEYLSRSGRAVDMLNNVHDAIDFQFLPKERGVYKKCLFIMSDFRRNQVICLPVETWDEGAIQRAGDQAVFDGKYTPGGLKVYEVPLPMEIEAGEGPNWAIATYGVEE